MSIPTTIVALLVLARTPEVFSEAYSLLMGNLCIRSEFILTAQGSPTDIGCATLCDRDNRCQAFTMADGRCQLFVFDKCSKSVRDCSCSGRGQVFVKQQPGLEAGQLCPTGYGDDLCGVKYKLLAGTNYWWSSRQKCESESGLVIMADVVNATDMSHVKMIYSSVGTSIWLGGLQAPGSPEPAGGWYWVDCNITVDSSLSTESLKTDD